MTNQPADSARYTSWGQDSDDRWSAFRAAVVAGTSADEAARQAGLPPLDEQD